MIKKKPDKSNRDLALDEIIRGYETELSGIESRKAEITELLRVLNKERGTAFSPIARQPQVISARLLDRPIPAKTQRGHDPNFSAVILDLLQSNPDRNFTCENIMAETGFNDHKTTRSTLARLYREGRIEKPTRALYRAKSPDGKTQSAVVPEDSKPVPTRITDFLSSNNGRSFRVTEIAAAMRDVNIKTLRAAILRLEASGKVSKTGRGTYRAGE